MKSSTSCRVCERWLEGDWSRATTDEERSSLQRQMDQGHCDGCMPPPITTVKALRLAVEREVIALYGGDLFVDGLGSGGLIASAWTAPGEIWTASQCHVIQAHSYTDTRSVWQDMLPRVAMGVEACLNEDCDCLLDQNP